jgi:hypothetical protein
VHAVAVRRPDSQCRSERDGNFASLSRSADVNQATGPTRPPQKDVELYLLLPNTRACVIASSVLKDIYDGFAQPIDREYRAVADRDRNCWNHAAGDYDHAGFQITPALGEMIGKPCERRTRILGHALADRRAADHEPTGNTDEILD